VKRFVGYLRLMRLANIVTAVSDILAGVAIAGSLVSIIFPEVSPGSSLGTLLIRQGNMAMLYPILLLVVSTACLYGGGVVLNDVFDTNLDKSERPERPIPSGLVSRRAAAIFGSSLLIAGIVAAALSDRNELFSQSTLLAMGIALASVVYDKWSKHNRFFGPLNMGFCRALNLLLGMSLLSYAVSIYWPVAIVPMIYIAAITMISRGEVHGGKRTSLYSALVLYILVLIVLLYIAFLQKNLLNTLPLAGIFSILIFPSLQQAIIKPEGPRIGKAVKSGVIALIAMNAAWAAAFGDIYFAVLILLLLPLSLLLAKLFAVT
jgi:4-hydroxybenzoate polyprenyltransferase